MNKSYNKYFKKVYAWLGIAVVVFAIASYFISTVDAFILAIKNATFFMSIVLINDFWLFPKYYLSNRRKFVIINALVTIVFAIALLVMEHYFGRHEPKEPKDIPFIFHIIRALSMVAFVNFISITLLLANALKVNAENEKKLKEEKLGTEIKLLKAQINPHFIFNALNNIYSLTYTKSEMAPESILKLSEMLRYVFYDCSSDHVKMGSEIEYISNYIAFQKMKSEHKQNIEFDFNDIKKDIDIAPMLFIPLIENAFKYSKIEEFKDTYVNMKLSSDKDSIYFEITNSIPSQTTALSGNGVGIKNVQQRLGILYPDKHKLDIYESDERYMVKLNIKTI